MAKITRHVPKFPTVLIGLKHEINVAETLQKSTRSHIDLQTHDDMQRIL